MDERKGTVTIQYRFMEYKVLLQFPNTPGSLYESCEWTDNKGNFGFLED